MSAIVDKTPKTVIGSLATLIVLWAPGLSDVMPDFVLAITSVVTGIGLAHKAWKSYRAAG